MKGFSFAFRCADLFSGNMRRMEEATCWEDEKTYRLAYLWFPAAASNVLGRFAGVTLMIWGAD